MPRPRSLAVQRRPDHRPALSRTCQEARSAHRDRLTTGGLAVRATQSARKQSSCRAKETTSTIYDDDLRGNGPFWSYKHAQLRLVPNKTRTSLAELRLGNDCTCACEFIIVCHDSPVAPRLREVALDGAQGAGLGLDTSCERSI